MAEDTALHGAPGQAESPDVLRGWLGGVQLSRLYVCLPVCCPHFTVTVQISEDLHTTQITLQNQPLWRPREEGPLQPSCPVSSPRLGWPPPLPMPSLLSLSVTVWTLGGNLREERRRPVAGNGFWPSQRQAGAMLYLYPSKGDPC